jgi:hypothetical protein
VQWETSEHLKGLAVQSLAIVKCCRLKGRIVMQIINGFAADWRGLNRFALTRGTAPMHGYEYISSADRNRARLDSYLPVDANGDPLVDAKRFEKEAGQAAQEFLRRARTSRSGPR